MYYESDVSNKNQRVASVVNSYYREDEVTSNLLQEG